jgi:hypothetical protein
MSVRLVLSSCSSKDLSAEVFGLCSMENTFDKVSRSITRAVCLFIP